MKKSIKRIFSGIGIAFLCLIIVGQVVKMATKPAIEASKEKYEFAKMIERADRDCPIPAAMGMGAVTGIKLENDFVTYYLKYDKDFSSIFSQVNDEAKVKEGLLMCFLCINAQGYDRGDLLMDMLIHYDYGLKVVVTESANGRFECQATVDEIKSLRDRFKINPHEALYNLLSLSIESERASLPMVIDEGMLMTDYQLEGEDIAIIIKLDEDLYSIEAMEENKEFIKASMMEEALTQPESKALLDLCKVSHTGLLYRMYGDQSRERVEIHFSSDEIRQIVPTPANACIQ